ncbi:PAS domain S-box protein [Persephonella sp.]|uniref:PAS domain S-box protein n=1 Tax=Persephonella sp. TaxID=2060922 RepID=UPI0026304863|nr:PAS domain S-box protein [Persephonella sp.]
MLRVFLSSILVILIIVFNIYYFGLRENIDYSVLVPNSIIILVLIGAYYLTQRLKDIPEVYYKVNLGFILILAGQANFISYFLTNEKLHYLLFSEIAVKLPGVVLTIIAFYQWIRNKEKKEEKLKESEEKWHSIVEGVNEIILILQENKIKYANAKIKEILGYDPEEIKDKSLYQIMGLNLDELLEKEKDFQIKLKTKDGQERIFEFNPSVITYEGKPAVLGIFRDITNRLLREKQLKETIEKLKETKEKLHEAQELARLGYWEFEPHTLSFFLSEEAQSIFCGKDKKCVMSFNEFLELVDPEDRRTVFEVRLEAIKYKRSYEIEYRINYGGEKIIKEKAKIIHENTPKEKLIGIVYDITEIHKAYQKVLENEERYRNLFEYSNDIIIITDLEGNIIDTNQKAVYKLGYNKFDIRIMNVRELFSEDFKKHFKYLLTKLLGTGHSRFEANVKKSDDTFFPAEISASVFSIRDKKYIQLLIRDITERKVAEKELKLASIVFENALEGIIITDSNGKVLRINKELEELTGFSKKDLIGTDITFLPIFRAKHREFQKIWHSVKIKGKWQGELIALKKNSEVFPVWLSLIQVKTDGKVTNYIAMITDITMRKHKEKTLENLAYYDTLTGIPNRTYFFIKLRSMIQEALRDHSKIALLFIDLDGFKEVNDTYGHEVGDKLLIEVAKRLKKSVRRDDFVARLAGDEFVVILKDVYSKEDIIRIAYKLLSNLDKPIFINGHYIHIGASIGIAVLPDDAVELETLVKYADRAMYHSKFTGKNRYTFYSDITDNIF